MGEAGGLVKLSRRLRHLDGFQEIVMPTIAEWWDALFFVSGAFPELFVMFWVLVFQPLFIAAMGTIFSQGMALEAVIGLVNWASLGITIELWFPVTFAEHTCEVACFVKPMGEIGKFRVMPISDMPGLVAAGVLPCDQADT